MDFSDVNQKLMFAFLSMYLYLLEDSEEYIEELKSKVTFHSDEANTDRGLKEVTKEFFLKKPKLSIEEETTFILNIDAQAMVFNLSDLERCRIVNVFLPEELSEEHRQSIKNDKQSILTNPDLYIEIKNDCTQQHSFQSLELKSTKKDKIPGSSAQQVNPYEWTIFVKHTDKTIEVVTGIYANTITGRLPFPDRSPRPEVSFSTLKEWNRESRITNYDGLVLNIDSQELRKKVNIISNWERVLIDEWLTYIKSDARIRKWFDRTQRKFVYELLEYYESLNEEEKNAFKLKNKI